ncbi:cell division protein FtsA [Coraliomargarita sp. SDUM461003]|uniref:Cell division protein FtsA n=1 Tax=Thalassobacterium maritimum TaxID=3041265 RepID=A0ABU1AS13_9BACT|nr:cell division protein FtsA [Coraliomargarita sp. SDUM461003]MBT61802.1 cell division protein FtsA [Puniceicoccaceae bacterium]MDQ8206838.1 cell division protein FtsA [Coraliomargarita sp. SDUM461003]
MSQSRVVAAVEIGTSKIAVLLGEILGDAGLNIIGHAVSSSKGVKKGEITDLDKASDCVHAAILKAEANAKTRVDEVYLAQTGRHLMGNFNVGSSNISSSDGVVRLADIDAAKEDAKRRTLPRDRTYIHHIQNPFTLDGRPVDNPLSKEGRQLQVGYWSVHGDSEAVSDSLRVIRGIDLDVSDMIISSIASGVVLLEESEKENGALVIDMGGGTTDYVLYRKGFIVKTGVVPVGGDHITNDLSIGLRVARKSAEEFKIKNGRAYYESEDREEKVWLFGDMTIGDHEYPLAAITKIIEARVAEVFDIIKEQLIADEVFEPSDIASGVVLTGGSSQLVGIDEAARRRFGLDARVSEGPKDVAEELRVPEYSTTLGLLHYALTGQEENQQQAKPSGILRRLTGLFN